MSFACVKAIHFKLTHPIVFVKTVSGIDNLTKVVWYLSRSSEPLSIYKLHKISGIALSSLSSLLNRLEELGLVLRTENGYTVNPHKVIVYDSYVIFRYNEDSVILVSPHVLTEDQLRQVFLSFPYHLKLWMIFNGELRSP